MTTNEVAAVRTGRSRTVPADPPCNVAVHGGTQWGAYWPYGLPSESS